MHRKSLKINENLGRREGMATNYGNLGLIYQERGDLDETGVLWTKARELYRRLGMTAQVEKFSHRLTEIGRA